MPKFTTVVLANNGVVATIYKAIEPKEILTCSGIFIRIDESAYLRVVISALEVVQASLLTPLGAKVAKMGYFCGAKLSTIYGTLSYYAVARQGSAMGCPTGT